MAVLMSVLSLLSLKLGYGLSGTCTPVCSGSHCVTVNQDRVDFKTAEETCRDMNGELMTFQGEAEESILDIVSQGLSGNFWIGLRLPAGACSNLSAPLRGYEWTSDISQFPPLSQKTPDKTTIKQEFQCGISESKSRLLNEQILEDMLRKDPKTAFDTFTYKIK
uniref:C-type lectin domain-containing protein n=1 Tax=Anabas testudineus TaxID=64144 RepID=A0A7N5ZR18_ANATE